MALWQSENPVLPTSLLRYGAAVGSVLLALLVSLLLEPWLERSRFFLFLGAVVFSAWYGGRRAGLLATILAVAILVFFAPIVFSFDPREPTTLVPLVLFAVLALLIIGISEARADAERSLHEQRARHQVTLASIGDAVIATDTAGRVTFMNGVAEQCTGWRQREALGKDLSQVFAIVNETTRAPVENPVGKVLSTGTVVGLANHTVLIARDGTETPIDDSGAPIRDEGGAIVGVVLVFRDIKERARAETERVGLLRAEQAARAEAEAAQERLAFLAEASAILASSLDYETTLNRVAHLAVPRLADWCGVDLLAEDGSIEQLAVVHIAPAKVEWARELRRRWPPDPQAPTGLARVLRTGQPEFYPEITDAMLVAAVPDPERLALTRAVGFTAGIVVPLTVHDRTLGALTLVSAESGRRYTEADLALAEDLARRAAVAIENARLYREAQEAIRMRDQFVSIASHELKTPLTSLLGYAQLLQRRAAREGTFNERDQRALHLIADQASRLNRMVLSLLDLSRIETGQLSIERGQVDLAALARRLAEEVQPTLERHTLHLAVPDSAVWIEGDALRLEQVVQNLLQNAVKYSPAGGTVTLRVTQHNPEACLAVTDEGIGIPLAVLPRLFHRFYRAPNADAHQISGIGLGLYVVQEIVTLHGGHIDVTSAEGKGSTFTVCLPLAAEAAG